VEPADNEQGVHVPDTKLRLTQEIKSLILENGIDMVGVASVDRWKHAPPDYFTPTYYMPEARTVISLARHIPDGVCDVWGTWDQPGRSAGPYLHYGYGLTNFDMARVIHMACKRLEHQGHRALAQPVATFSHYRRMDYYVPAHTTRPDFSQMHTAVAAGLGEFGWHGIFISTRFGPRVRLGSIITSAPLEVDPMYDGEPLCQPERCGHRCRRVCPVDAFSSTETTTIRIGDSEYHKAKHDNVRCAAAVNGTTKGSGSRSEVVFPPGELTTEYTAGRWPEVHWSDREIRGQTFGIIGGNYCGRCLQVCPAPFAAGGGSRRAGLAVTGGAK
jgi:epoxyqueuosine reductase QueG